MKNLANGSAKIIASTTGWDINPRVLGTVPKEAKVGTLKGFHWVTDAHYAVVPKGVSADKQAAVLALLKWMLTTEPAGQGLRQGLLLPRPGDEGRRRCRWRPEKSRKAIEEYGRPEYDRADRRATRWRLRSMPRPLVAAFDRWDREIGGGQGEEVTDLTMKRFSAAAARRASTRRLRLATTL